MPVYSHSTLQAVQNALSSNDLKAAEKALSDASDVPEHIQEHARALLQFARGQVQEGVDRLNALLASQADYPEPWLTLGELCQQLGKTKEAMACFNNHIGQAAADVRGYLGLANLLMTHKDTVRARAVLEKAVAAAPENGQVRQLLGRMAYDVGDYPSAVRHLNVLWEAGGREPQLALLLGESLLRRDLPADALECLRTVSGEPFHSAALVGQASALIALERYDECLALITNNVDSMARLQSELLALRGSIHVQRNEPDQAREVFRQALQRDEQTAEAWKGLCLSFPETVTDDELRRVEALAHAQGPAIRRVTASYCAAAVHEYRGELQAQMQWLETGSSLRLPSAYFDRDSVDGIARIHTGHFTKERLSALAAVTPDADEAPLVPVFIIGLPRSGTTLTEQILGAHQQVFCSGESGALAYANGRALAHMGVSSDTDLLACDESDYLPVFRRAMREHYFALMAQHGDPQPFVTDKAMNLYVAAGLLRRAFPEARFVLLQRDPVDVCFGAYKTLFVNGQHQSYRFEDLAWHYRHFQQVMDHWKAQPSMDVFEMHYETLVLDQEQTSRALLAHCGLGWQGEVLAFQDHQRAVRTASAVQVRQGLYSTAVQRWRRYGALLDPLTAALRAQGVDVDAYAAELQLGGATVATD